MNLLKGFLIALLLTLTSANNYQLDFDWTLDRLTTRVEVAYVSWNNQIVAKLKEQVMKDTVHHVRVNLTFSEGENQLSFFFIGIYGELTIGNVAITKPPRNINLLVNGDFVLPKLDSSLLRTTFADKIMGWTGSQIELTRQPKLTTLSRQAIILNPEKRSIKQKVTFGKVNQYSFISSISSEIQAMANDIIQRNLDNYSQNFSKPATGNTNYTLQTTPNNNSPALTNFTSDNTTQLFSNFASQIYDKLQQLKDQQFGDNQGITPPINETFPQ